MKYILEQYETDNDKCPFENWLGDIEDIQAHRRIRAALDKLSLGNFGNCESVKDGVYEFKMRKEKNG